MKCNRDRLTGDVHAQSLSHECTLRGPQNVTRTDTGHLRRCAALDRKVVGSSGIPKGKQAVHGEPPTNPCEAAAISNGQKGEASRFLRFLRWNLPVYRTLFKGGEGENCGVTMQVFPLNLFRQERRERVIGSESCF